MVKEKAKEYIRAGLSVLPTREGKGPALNTWKPLQQDRLTEEELDQLYQQAPIREGAVKAIHAPIGIAVITGKVSGDLEVLDVDTKHDQTGTLWEDLRETIREALPGLLDRTPIVTTGSGGKHIYYRCEEIEGNQKLAHNGDGEDTLETRGDGGYVVAPPTPGYSIESGSLADIPYISQEERTTLLNIARSFDLAPVKVETVDPPQRTSRPLQRDGLSPLEDYNQQGDVVALLTRHGYRVVGGSGDRVKLLRPGNPSSPYSGDWHEGKRKLWLWSSTDLPPGRALSASDVYACLECSGDMREAARRLRREGYGSPLPTKNQQPTQTMPKALPTPPADVSEISVTIVNIKTGEGEPVDLDRVKDSQGIAGSILITSASGGLDPDRVMAVADRVSALGRPVFVNDGSGDRPIWEYMLEAIIASYPDLGPLEEDALLGDVVEYGQGLDPLDKDRYFKTFTSLPDVVAMGIKEETLHVVEEKLATTRAEENQRKEALEAVRKAKEDLTKGEPSEVIERLQEALYEVKSQAKERDIAKLLAPMTEAGLKEWYQNVPEAVVIQDLRLYKHEGVYKDPEPLTLPAGALTVIAGGTGHGKTTILLNLALRILEQEGREVVFLSYEEAKEPLARKFLVSYIGEPISENSRKSAEVYFKTNSDSMIKRERRSIFHKKREEFFRNYMETGRLIVQDVDYKAEVLVGTIQGILKQKPQTSAIFIDYIQLLQLGNKNRSGTRQEELAKICEELKVISKKAQIPIVLGAQFNREVNAPWKMSPLKIREAGDIEHSASLILGIWDTGKSWGAGADKDPDREEYEGRKFAFSRYPGTQGDPMYVKVLKNREGQDGLEAFYEFDRNAAKIHGVDEAEAERLLQQSGPKAKMCPSCTAMMSLSETKCQHCGHTEKPKKVSTRKRRG